MGKLIKIVLIVFATLVVLLAIAAVVLVAVVDPNDYKGRIAEIVEQKTGRELTFEGDIGFSFFPWLGVDVGPVALGNAPGFTPDEMVRINKAGAAVKIMPLLSGNVEIDRIILDGFTLHLTTRKDGSTNLDDLLEKSRQSAEKPQPTPTQAPTDGESAEESGGLPISSLKVGGVEITDASVILNDQAKGSTTTVQDLALDIGEVEPGKPFTFELSFHLTSDQPKLDISPQVSGTAMMDLDREVAQLTNLKVKLLNVSATGEVLAEKIMSSPAFSGSLSLAQFSPRELMEMLGMTPPQTADSSVLGKASADLTFHGSKQGDQMRVNLDSLKVVLDDTTMTGTAAARIQPSQAFQFKLAADAVDADRYLPPKEQASQQSSPKPASAEKPSPASSPAQEPDLSALRTLDLNGTFTPGRLKVMNLTITDIAATVRAKDGVLNLDPFQASLYGGSANAAATVDARRDVPSWSKKASLSDMQIGPFLKDFQGKDQLVGTTSAKLDLRGSGLTPDRIKRSITGTASFAVLDGAINGINVAKMIRDAWDSFKGMAPSRSEVERTDFAELSASAKLNDGHITNDDLSMKSPLLRLTGEGWADLPKNSLNYLATVTLVGTLKGQEGESLAELRGVPLPIRARGSLDSPSIALDPKALADALFKGKAEEGVQNLKDSLRDKLLGGEKDKEDSSGSGKKVDPRSLIKNLFNQ